MKKLILPLAILLGVSTVFAQSAKYEGAMKSNLSLLKNAKTSADYLNVSGAFERIASAEKTQWLPYYYAALAQLDEGMNDPQADKDAIGKKVDELLTSAEAIDKNAELSVLHYYNETMEMTVNPQERWQTSGVAMAKYVKQTMEQDATNPRIYFLMGENIFHTPENFGGGKEKAKPIFQKSVDLFATFKPASDISPNWGKQLAEKMLEECDK
ncbi:hypothetical protein [Arachidicoccus sp.]|uniref:hypothetical protein n=1 Tax=Arachidicoccus sp. TaxID=1872624 RepID=UPI003D25ECBE